MLENYFCAITRNILVSTKGKGTYEITDRVQQIVSENLMYEGILNIFVQHTSASILIYENADPTARQDLHTFFEKLIPDNNSFLVHTHEGMDDSTSHLRVALTNSSETVPILDSTLQLGIWQGIYLFEHRVEPHQRNIMITFTGMIKNQQS